MLKRSIHLFLNLLVLLLAVSVQSYANEDSSKVLGSDFSSYEPVASEEDAYTDENFMYFDSRFVVSLGTGIQSWTGGAGKLFKPAYPTLDFKLAHFIDVGWAMQYGLSYVRHAGNIDPGSPVLGRSGLVELQQLRVSFDIKRYFKTSMHSVDEENITQVDSPAPYFLTGIEYSKYNLVFRKTEESQKYNIPLPCVGLGIDFSLKPRKTSFEVEARYYPAGLLFSDFDFNGSLGGNRIGNIFAINAAVKFLFDAEPKSPILTPLSGLY